MVWIAGVIGGWILFSAALLIVLCMFSSRLSQAEGREEIWTGHEARSKAPAERHLQGAPSQL